MAVRLHRCPLTFVRMDGHPCWRVQKALDEAGVDYAVVKGPLRRDTRAAVRRLTGQGRYPVIEFEDGTAYRDESQAMAERIAAGRLFEGRA